MLFTARSLCLLAICAIPIASPTRALAADVLFVSDSAPAGTEIPEALRADGHTVVVVAGDFATGNAALLADLSAYHLVVWAASGESYGSTHQNATVFTNLETYVTNGGRVLVTGYDSIASPTDPLLISFLGGTASRDVPPPLGAITAEANSLTVGFVDIRGLTPAGAAGDRDALTGVLPGTVIVCPSASDPTQGQWTLRTLGTGEIAYVSNGNSGGGGHPSWLVSTAGPTGVFNGALRNFAAAASTASVRVVEVPPDDPAPPIEPPDPDPLPVPPPATVAPPPAGLAFNAPDRSGFGWAASLHAAAAHTTEEQRWFVGGSAAVGLRFNLDREGADERRHGPLNGLLGDSFGIDARGHVFGRVDDGNDAAYGVAVGGALVAVNALRGGDVRIPSLVGLMLPEVGAMFRDDLDPRLYVAFHAPFSFLLESWLSLDLRASLFFVDAWRIDQGREMLISVSVGVGIR